MKRVPKPDSTSVSSHSGWTWNKQSSTGPVLSSVLNEAPGGGRTVSKWYFILKKYHKRIRNQEFFRGFPL